MSPLSSALCDYAEELEEEASGSGLTYLKELRDRSLAFITSGKETQFVSATVNGQSFTAEAKVTASDMFVAVSDAINCLRKKTVQMTYPTFEDIPH